MGGGQTIEELRAKFSYDPETGLFTRLRREYDPTSALAPYWAAWNARYAGKPALSVDSGNGYLCGNFGGRMLLAHRAAWALATGAWPVGQIDHINGDRTDNRLVNLRDVSVLENRRNCRRLDQNTSGRTGVSFRPDKKKWRAFISLNNRAVHLGYFRSYESAVEARERAERDLGFHPNHGRAA